MALASAKCRHTVAEYLEFERQAIDRHEYHEGEVRAMSAGSLEFVGSALADGISPRWTIPSAEADPTCCRAPMVASRRSRSLRVRCWRRELPMGSTIWFEIQGRPLKETADDCSLIKKRSDELDRLALHLDVQKFSSFFDYSEMARAADAELKALTEIESGDTEDADDAEELEDQDLCDELTAVREQNGDWFDAAEALRTLTALRAYLEDHPEVVNFGVSPPEAFPYHARLLDELRLGERLAGEAVAEGKQFRLLIVP